MVDGGWRMVDGDPGPGVGGVDGFCGMLFALVKVDGSVG